jgi:hypothetical protein
MDFEPVIDAIGMESGTITPKRAFSPLHRTALVLLKQSQIQNLLHLSMDFKKSQLG